MTQTIDILEQARRDHAVLRGTTTLLPPLRFTSITTPPPEYFNTGAEIEQRIDELNDGHLGWCRRASWVGRTPCAALAEHGHPLDGEWVSRDGATSLRLMFFNGRWRLFTIAEARNGHGALREDVALLDHDGARLWYAIYWAGHADDPAGLRRTAYRLTGFGGTEAPK